MFKIHLLIKHLLSFSRIFKSMPFFLLSKMLLLLLLFNCVEMKAQETFKIDNFENLHQQLEERISAHSSQCGPICRELEKVKKSFKQEYRESERESMIVLLDKALMKSSKSPVDKKVIEDIKLQFKDSPLNVSQAVSNPQYNSLLEDIKELENAKRNFMIFSIFAMLLAVFGLMVMKKFREKLIEQKVKTRNLEKELIELQQKNFENAKMQKLNYQTHKEPPSNEKTFTFEVSNIEDKYKQENPIETKQPLNLNLFYLSTPQTDGYFNDVNKTATYLPTSSMYKFNLLSAGKAKFEFVNDISSLKDALNYPDIYLLPVCRSLNVRNIHAHKIVTEEHGIAELREGKWIVSKKAVIRYE